MRVCPACGVALPDVDAFCSACGADVRNVRASCASCGEQVDSTARFCGACGSPAAVTTEGTPDVRSEANGESVRRGRVVLALAAAMIIIAAVAAVVAYAIIERRGAPEASSAQGPGPVPPAATTTESTSLPDAPAENGTSHDLAGAWEGTLTAEEQCVYGGEWEASHEEPFRFFLLIYDAPMENGVCGEVSMTPPGGQPMTVEVARVSPAEGGVEVIVEYRFVYADRLHVARLLLRRDGDSVTGTYWEDDEPPMESWISRRGRVDLVMYRSE